LFPGASRAEAVLLRALDQARVAAGAELLGVMARALEVSVQYIGMREQFGRPIGSFQALQHRAANLLIQVELTRAVVMQSAAVADTHGADPRRLGAAASQAKARASSAALEVTKGCIQLHGGIGYTDECSIGLFLKKAMVGAAWLGAPYWHRRRYNEVAPASGRGAPVRQPGLRSRAGGRYELGEALPLQPGLLLGLGLFLSAGVGLVALVLPGILVTLGTANRTAERACEVYVSVLAPGAVDAAARFELVSPTGTGWNCYAIDFDGDELLVRALGLIPGGARVPIAPPENS